MVTERPDAGAVRHAGTIPSSTSTTLVAVTRAVFCWGRFSHEGARRSRAAVHVWPWFETLGQNPQHPAG